jgi:hypothetical protein
LFFKSDAKVRLFSEPANISGRNFQKSAFFLPFPLKSGLKNKIPPRFIKNTAAF